MHPDSQRWLNDLDRFHLVMDTIDRVPQTGEKGLYLKDLPEIRQWKWGVPSGADN
jgi:xylulose-5-phosphate/fructose-6-phosphate phosphoketolase